MESVERPLRTLHQIPMDDAEELTGVSRRTLSTAVRNEVGRSDAEVAAEYRDSGHDLHYGGEELHRRYPQLAGLHTALRLLVEAEEERWQAAHPDQAFAPLLEFTDEQLVLRREYERWVDAIAEGRISR